MSVNNADPTPTILDLKGYKCPLPVLKARKAIYGAPAGSQFIAQVTDPKAPTDFAEFCKVAGYHLVQTTATDFGHEIEIKV